MHAQNIPEVRSHAQNEEPHIGRHQRHVKVAHAFRGAEQAFDVLQRW
jgi:hypothetical protein